MTPEIAVFLAIAALAGYVLGRWLERRDSERWHAELLLKCDRLMKELAQAANVRAEVAIARDEGIDEGEARATRRLQPQVDALRAQLAGMEETVAQRRRFLALVDTLRDQLEDFP